MSCGICKKTFQNISRYGNIICSECQYLYRNEILDRDGNNVYYCNEGISGGFNSVHLIKNNKVVKQDHECWFRETKCYADEARFGGIVIMWNVK